MTAPQRPADWEPLVLLDEDVARVAAAHLCRWASEPAAEKLSERAQLVTEGRNGDSLRQKWFHSSCGDLVWFMHWWLGNREPRVNRSARKYTIGANLSNIYSHPEFIKGPCPNPLPGDVLYVQSPDHVAVSLGVVDGVLTVAQYGGTGGRGTDGRVTVYAAFDGAKLGRRRVIGHLPLWATIQRAERAGQLELAYVPPGMPKP